MCIGEMQDGARIRAKSATFKPKYDRTLVIRYNGRDGVTIRVPAIPVHSSTQLDHRFIEL